MSLSGFGPRQTATRKSTGERLERRWWGHTLPALQSYWAATREQPPVAPAAHSPGSSRAPSGFPAVYFRMPASSRNHGIMMSIISTIQSAKLSNWDWGIRVPFAKLQLML